MRVTTSDGLYLHGYYVSSSRKNTAVLHIHGFEGNFYENWFVHILAKRVEDADIAFLTVNTRGNGKDTDFNTTDGKMQRVGAHYELLEDAHKDITAWIEFLLHEGYSQIILQGHSLGTYKAVRYLFEGDHKEKINKLILLAPFDKKALVESFTKCNIKKLLTMAQKKIEEGKGDEIITRDFETIDLSYKTYVSWYKQDDLGRIFEFCNQAYNFSILHKISIPTKVIVGSKDEYFHISNPEHPEEAINILLQHIPNAQGKIINDALHSFQPHEEELANEIIHFVLEQKNI